MLISAPKNWDGHVTHAELIARSPGFQDLRDQILALAAPEPGQTAVDVGSGTGLLTLPLAQRGLRVWAVDLSSGMTEYLRTKAQSAGDLDVLTATASAVSLPLVDECADLVVSNYCFHHLPDPDKHEALREVVRVLKPGGRFVFGDMMFTLSLTGGRDREVVRDKVAAMLRRGPAGAVRLAKNALRLASGRWEHPQRAEWWQQAMSDAGLVDVEVRTLAHEGGIASARKPG